MPVTQVVLDNLRNRNIQSRILGGPRLAAALTTLAIVAAGIAGLASPAASARRATFTPAIFAYLASATTTAAHADGGTGGTGGSVTITFTVPPAGTGPGGTGPGGSGPGGTGPGGTGPGGTGPGGTGDFTVTVQPGTVTLQEIGESGVATGVLQTITVSDTRSWAPGWSVRGQESDFTGKHGVRPRIIPGTALGWVPAGTLARGATLGPAVDPGDPGIGDTGPLLAAAGPGSGVGTSTLSADLTLAVPAFARTEPNSGLLTITYLETASLPASSSPGPLPQAG